MVNIHYACQRHYFGAMAEAYFENKLRDASVNVQRQQKTVPLRPSTVCLRSLPART